MLSPKILFKIWHVGWIHNECSFNLVSYMCDLMKVWFLYHIFYFICHTAFSLAFGQVGRKRPLYHKKLRSNNAVINIVACAALTMQTERKCLVVKQQHILLGFIGGSHPNKKRWIQRLNEWIVIIIMAPEGMAAVLRAIDQLCHFVCFFAIF